MCILLCCAALQSLREPRGTYRIALKIYTLFLPHHLWFLTTTALTGWLAMNVNFIHTAFLFISFVMPFVVYMTGSCKNTDSYLLLYFCNSDIIIRISSFWQSRYFAVGSELYQLLSQTPFLQILQTLKRGIQLGYELDSVRKKKKKRRPWKPKITE